jgi:hypothetical protein
MIRHGAYRANYPCVLKNKNKKILPAFWQNNGKACVTAVLSTEWFHLHYIADVKEYLEKEVLPLKFYK